MAASVDLTGESSYCDLDLFSVIGRPESVDAWKENTDIAQYLQELSSYGVQQLSQEPERLSEEKSLVLEQTQELAFENYKTFIQTAQCSRDIFQEFSVVEGRLESLQSKLPLFAKKCQDFGQQSQQITSRWRQMSLILSKHPQLLEILELAQLMDTCVRNSYYDEALELAAYVRQLERKHNNVPLIVSIAAEVQESQQLMLNQLLQQLRTAIQLPACLKVIGYLRRMDVFSEAELRVKFLQARTTWFQSILSSIPTKDAYMHITRVVEACRVHLFDIVTQYRAIFSDEDPISSITARDNNEPMGAIFYSWVTSRVSDFLHILENDLQRDMGGRIDSVLSQCMYFGLSFSRVGADFRPLLARKFQVAILARYTHTISEVTSRFQKMMHSFTLTNLPPVGPAAMLMSSLTAEENLGPPFSLLEFEPLSQYCNGVLTAFNELRLCACLSIAKDVTLATRRSLESVVAAITDFYAAEESTLTQKESEAFSRLCSGFANELVPFLDRCLSVLFPSSQIAKVLGLPTTHVTRMENIGHLDCDSIIAPMKHLVSDFEEDFSVPPSNEEETPDEAAHTEAAPEQVSPDAVEESVGPTEVQHSRENVVESGQHVAEESAHEA
uniref:Conserved oligomeric Golgi complex subunit 8 n=1 Tax=Ornithodoros turicata TaxID=34597 RepID=A0A2R5LMK9_9ACAR